MRKAILSVFLILLVMPFSLAYEITETTTCKVVYDDNQEEMVECPPTLLPAIDVVFVIDSTGSMADEIREVKTHIINIVKAAQSGYPRPDMRVGVVAYRDHEPEEREYLYRKFDLTYDINEALDFIANIEARGGGDLPEAVADALDVAINQMDWKDRIVMQNQEQIGYRPYTKRLVFLVGDAAPHGEGSTDNSFVQGCPEGHNYRDNIADANRRGITIYTVSGSGIDSVGIRIFREIAEETGGQYTHLSYIRQDVDKYYAEEGIDKRWLETAKSSPDYDTKTNSILTNTLGKITQKAVMAEAMDIGVSYDNPTPTDNVINPILDEIDDRGEETGTLTFYEWLESIWDKIVFWD